MKFILLLTFLVSVTSLSAFAADPTVADLKKQETMAKMKEYSTPGEGQKVLAAMTGNWTYTSKWWESADAVPQESTGTSHLKMIMGGRYLQNDTKGKAMGMPLQGMGLTAYDNLKKIYETIWLDNMGTGIVKGQGQYDPATKTLSDKGEYTSPTIDSLIAEYRGEWKMVDANNMVYAMYGKGMAGDKEFKMMEMIYKRKKK